MRWSGVGTFLPPRARSTASARVAFQRQREPNIGVSSIACTSRCFAVSGFRYWNTSSSGKLCWGPSDRTIASSVAAACSSKLKLRQNRLRSARPHARLTRLPNGACSTSCIPPASSKKRSSTSVSCVGITPRKETLVLERSEEHTSELQSRLHLVCRLLLEKKKKKKKT